MLLFPFEKKKPVTCPSGILALLRTGLEHLGRLCGVRLTDGQSPLLFILFFSGERVI